LEEFYSACEEELKEDDDIWRSLLAAAEDEVAGHTVAPTQGGPAVAPILADIATALIAPKMVVRAVAAVPVTVQVAAAKHRQQTHH
jgi:hypothetical protein